MTTSSTWYRRTLWNYKGNREYTRSGYEAAATRFTENDLDVDCSDRHYMITGSNSGIGLQTALDVAKRGGVIHMVCRNREAATKARSEVITTTGNDKIHLHIVDLARPREVVAWAQRFAAQHERLHVLVHNAGCMVHERRLDEDGVEVNFAVNTLALHIMVLTFMPLLESRSEDSRVVIVSSAGMLSVRLMPNDLMHANMEPFDGRLVYSQNKRQQVVMGLWYAQRYNKVHFSSMHPGWVDTNAVRTSLPQFYEMMKDNLRTPEQGADTVVWLAISRGAIKHPSGLFFQDREPVSSHLPLAWTKTTIAEEDTLMQNIQEVYINIYNKMYPQIADGQGASASTYQPPASTHQPAAAAVGQISTEEAGLKSKEEGAKEEAKVTGKVEETSLTETPVKALPETSAFPVLPPPPPPASKVTSRLEVQEVAEIHAPPTSSQRKDDIAQETKEELKPSDLQEEKKIEETEGKTDFPKEKADKTEKKKTEKAEKGDTPEDKHENARSQSQEEKKTDVPEEKADCVEEKTEKTEEKATPKDKEENSSSPAQEKEERTEVKEDTGKENTTSTPTSDPVLPEP